ncbi:MAG: hypothetical protein ACON5F_03540 [Jejuia sp.]
MLKISYEIKNNGWAIGKICNEHEEYSFTVSNLLETLDPLKALAKSAIEIREKEYISILFIEEPGEYALILKKSSNNQINYEFRYYKEIETYNTQSDYELIIEGKTSIPKYINQIRNILVKIFNEIGPEEYLKRWVKNVFPLKEYEELK